MRSDDIANITERLSELPEMDPPEGLVEDIMVKLSQPRKGWLRKSFELVFTPYPLTLRPVSIVAVTCLLILVGYMVSSIGPGRKGIEYSTSAKNVSPTPHSAESNFYLGRGFMAAGLVEEALPFLQNATMDAPENPQYAMWAGLCFAANGRNVEERLSYRRAMEYMSATPTLLLNIGHSYLEERNYEAAVTYYDKVLSLDRTEQAALYNKALIFHLQGQKIKERAAWKQYLHHYSYGVNGFRAVQRLNDLDDFTYRTYQIGPLKIILNQAELLNINDQNNIIKNVDQLSRYLHHNSSLQLEIVTYIDQDLILAKKKAIQIKQQLVMQLGSSFESRIRLSWFGVPETIHTESDAKLLRESVLIFAQKTNKSEQETSI